MSMDSIEETTVGPASGAHGHRWVLGSPTSTMIMNASVWVTFGGAPAKDTGFILRCPVGNWGHGDPYKWPKINGRKNHG